jgi:hypothetical protein
MRHRGEKDRPHLLRAMFVILQLRDIRAYRQDLGATVDHRGLDLDVLLRVFRFKYAVNLNFMILHPLV